MSFDSGKSGYSKPAIEVSIPFEQGYVFRLSLYGEPNRRRKSQSLSNRAMSFDEEEINKVISDVESQSLSNRAMSFDAELSIISLKKYVSIPFEQGYVFRHTGRSNITTVKIGLNPFRTGLCLSTISYLKKTTMF